MRVARLLAVFLFLIPALPARAADPSPSELYEQLQQVKLSPLRTFRVTDVYLQRDAVRLHLQHGTLVFLEPVAGRVTGALFEGAGQVLVRPPNRTERQQLIKFTGSPILAEPFRQASFRFSDATAAELLQQIHRGAGRAVHEPEWRQQWEPSVDRLNRAHALRLLLDLLETPQPYFYASIRGQRLGAFDVIVDARRQEEVLVGQLRRSSQQAFYDIWCSFSREPAASLDSPARIARLRIESTITGDGTLEATAELHLQLKRGVRALLFDLSRRLRVASVDLRRPEGGWQPVDFFQNPALSEQEVRFRGTDMVLVALTEGLGEASRSHTLRFRYRGRIISPLGAGIFFVGARSFWYPFIDSGEPLHCALRFRFPRSLELVATGTLKEEKEEGRWKESLWLTEAPVPLAGFNLGKYDRREIERGSLHVTAFANREIEPYLARALRSLWGSPPPRPPEPESWSRIDPSPPRSESGPPLRAPTFHLQELAGKVADALVYFSRLFGPYRYSSLKVTQISGRFGQGFPGLIYLSTFSYLPEGEQALLGLNERAREYYSELTPAHETAHQWWGNRVRFPDYRDQWLNEGLATYSALLYLNQQAEEKEPLREWLEHFRRELRGSKENGEGARIAGPLTLGQRLDSSRSPNGFVRVIYNKAPWVLHMLRELFRDPATGSDKVFLSVLRSLADRGGTVTTDQFRQQLEAVLPPHADVEKTGRLDWFFEQWVHEADVPHYALDWEADRSATGGWQVAGTIKQFGVSELFTMPLPVYARTGNRFARLGKVLVTGEQVSFRFSMDSRPEEVLLDPYGTVLWFPAE